MSVGKYPLSSTILLNNTFATTSFVAMYHIFYVHTSCAQRLYIHPKLLDSSFHLLVYPTWELKCLFQVFKYFAIFLSLRYVLHTKYFYCSSLLFRTKGYKNLLSQNGKITVTAFTISSITLVYIIILGKLNNISNIELDNEYNLMHTCRLVLIFKRLILLFVCINTINTTIHGRHAHVVHVRKHEISHLFI